MKEALTKERMVSQLGKMMNIASGHWDILCQGALNTLFAFFLNI